MTTHDPKLEELTKQQADLFNSNATEDQRIRIAEEIRRVQDQRRNKV